MKTNNTIRSMAAMMVILFAVTTTSCQKENEITPNPGTGVTTPPVNNTPPPVAVPPLPAVNTKPRFITTVANGSTVRSQGYEYDSQGKLIRYFSKNTASVDSVILSGNVALFKTARNSGTSVQKLIMNSNKTMRNLISDNIELRFEHNQNKINTLTQSIDGGTFNTVARMDYLDDNLSAINGEAVISYTYYNNLPYQKGINELPTALKPFQYYKVLEQEEATSNVLYKKLLKQSVLNTGGRREMHEFVYAFDSDNRVSKITETITITVSGNSTQKTSESIISY